jgi:DNA-binding response OmpR family regulator
MAAAVDLTGRRVLVLEDDYYLSSDAREALTSAGAEVVGPFAREAAALSALEADGINAAIVDINLGSGPSFATARALQKHGVPFLFLTGYDQSTIPDEFASIHRIEKPADIQDVIRAIKSFPPRPH